VLVGLSRLAAGARWKGHMYFDGFVAAVCSAYNIPIRARC